jgi:hypothetical protein
MKRTIPRQPRQDANLFDQPEFDLPDLPTTNLTSVNDDTLMELFAQFTAYQNWAAVKLAEAEVAEAKAEANARHIEAMAMVSGWGPRDKVTVAKAELSTTPEVERARQDVLTAYAQRKLTKVMYDNTERCVFVVSRELSRRIGNVGYERRTNRWNP